jgi:hypothetical protein
LPTFGAGGSHASLGRRRPETRGGRCPLPIRGSRSLSFPWWPGGVGLDNFQPGGTSHSEERWIARRRASSGESSFPDR